MSPCRLVLITDVENVCAVVLSVRPSTPRVGLTDASSVTLPVFVFQEVLVLTLVIDFQ
jgi:hypothetical protein